MNKTEMIDAMASESGLTKAETTKAIDAIIKVGTKTLGKGERIVLSNVATFSVKYRAARQGRNPQTGNPIVISAKKVVSFKPNCPPPH
jgi:DNA-binding protein HU-beta